MDYVQLVTSLSAIDRRVIYLVVAIAIILPLVFVPNPPMSPTEEGTSFHHVVQRLQEGDVVLLATDYNAGTAAELGPMTTTLAHHVFARGAKLVVVSLDAQGTGVVEAQIDTIAQARGCTYGEDWVFLGFRPSAPAVILALASSPYTLFPEDFRGNRLIDLPLTDRLKGAADYAVLVVMAAGPTATDWVIYGSGRFEAPILLGLSGGIGPTFRGFYNTQQVAGMLAGLRGAAEYEQLTHRSGDASRLISAQSSVHLLLVLLIVVGNVSFLVRKWLESALR
jgi:hypothetical protein